MYKWKPKETLVSHCIALMQDLSLNWKLASGRLAGQ